MANLLTSGDFLDAQDWTRLSGVSVVADLLSPLAPDSSATADRLNHTVSNQGGLWQAFTFQPLTTYCISVYQWKDSVSGYAATFRFRVKQSPSTSDIYSAYFSSYSSPGAWVRRSFSFTTGATVGLGQIGITHEVSVGTYGIFWGIQLVEGSSPDSYDRSVPPLIIVAPNTIDSNEVIPGPSVDRLIAGTLESEPFTKAYVEKDYNLLIAGNNMLNAAWVQLVSTTVSLDNVLSPTLNLTADTVVYASGQSAYTHQKRLLQPSTQYTMSVYLRRDTGFSGSAAGMIRCWLQGTEVASPSWATIADVWLRISLTFTTSPSLNPGTLCELGWKGTAGAQYAIWGAQLVQAGVSIPYVEDASKIITPFVFGGADEAAGITRYPSIDRMAGGKLETLPFTQRLVTFDVNLLREGDKFNSPKWVKTNGMTVRIDQEIAPSGFRSADTLTVPASTAGYCYQKYKLQPSTQYTASFYVQKVASFTGSMVARARVYAQGTEYLGAYTTAGLTWKRVAFTFTTSAGLNGSLDSEVGFTGIPGDFAIWGYQLIIGATPVDYQEAQLQTIAPDPILADRVFGTITINGLTTPFVPDDRNLLKYGDPLHAVRSPSDPTPIWTKSGANTWLNDVEPSPRGDTKADILVKAAGNDGSFYQVIPGSKLVAGYQYTISIYVKLPTMAVQTSGTTQIRVRPHVTGTPEVVSAYGSMSRTWKRYTLTFIVTSAMAVEGARVIFYNNTNITPLAFWGAQVVPGDTPDFYLLYPFVPFVQPATLSTSEQVNDVRIQLAGGQQTIYASTVGPRKQPRQMGMNMAQIAYYTPEWTFPDLFKTARAGKKSWVRSGPLLEDISVKETSGWVSAQASVPWSWENKQPIAIDAHGWVTSLGNDQSVYALMMRTAGPFGPTPAPFWPDGHYVCMWDGDGTIDWTSNVLQGTDIVGIVESGSNYAILDLRPRGMGVLLKITATNPANYIRNIRFWMPGFEGSSKIFHPKILETWRGFPVIRFMTWQGTNTSMEATWAQRAHPLDATYASTSLSVPLEICIEYANAMHADGWFNIPAMANADYVEQMAITLRDNLDPSLRIYLEYTNEFWNGSFTANWWLGKIGAAEGLQDTTKPSPLWEGQMHAYARNAERAFNIFDQVFAGNRGVLKIPPNNTEKRVIRILGGMRGSSAVCRDLYSYARRYTSRADGKAADAFTSNYYFGNSIGATAQPITTLDEVFAYIDTHITNIKPLQESVTQAANDLGLRHIIYEGGPHLAQPFTAPLTMDLIVQASRDARMYDRLLQTFSDWRDMAGEELFIYFESTGAYGFFGAFPLLEDFMTAENTQAQRAKYRAVLADLDLEQMVGTPNIAFRASAVHPSFEGLLLAV